MAQLKSTDGLAKTVQITPWVAPKTVARQHRTTVGNRS